MDGYPAKVLAEPVKLKNGTTIKNRFLKSAMSEVLGSPANRPTNRHVRLYSAWAQGGVGLAITGNVMIDRRALGEPGNVVIEDERDLDLLKSWAAAGTAEGTHLWMQINHPGKQAPGFLSDGGQPVAPSAVPFESSLRHVFKTPRALTNSEIEDLIDRFRRTAGIARKAGFTGVQIHGAHGYLVSQFLSPKANRRTDRWGGSLDNRMRFVLEIYNAIRQEVGDDFPVSIKINSADFQKGGFSEDDSVAVMAALADAGMDLIEISGGTYEAAAMTGAFQKESTRKREAYFLQFAERVRNRIDTALAVTGGFQTDEGMAEAVASGAVDMVGLARAFTLVPDFPNRILAGQGFKSPVRKMSTGVKLVDTMSMMDVTYFENQIAAIASGKGAQPGMSAWESVARTFASQGLQAFRQRRAN